MRPSGAPQDCKTHYYFESLCLAHGLIVGYRISFKDCPMCAYLWRPRVCLPSRNLLLAVCTGGGGGAVTSPCCGGATKQRFLPITWDRLLTRAGVLTSAWHVR